ncbi:hypothetical protein LTR15_010900 [Elasticomyces elasticus]|nr:hypothetical protein LTR15_010900 [Elasticomyces elasticus]
MDKLPPEILGLIARECDFTPLKHLRETNRYLNEVMSPVVFEHFYMAYFPKCLGNLCELATSPLAKHVKAFTFYTDLLPDWTGATFKTQATFHPGNIDPPPQYTQDQLDKAWHAYQYHRAEQAFWTEDQESFIFKRHFDMLPNVSEAHLVRAYTTEDENIPPVWKALHDEILVWPIYWSLSANPYDFVEGQPALCLLEAIGYRARSSGRKPITSITIHSRHRQSYLDLLGATTGRSGMGRVVPSSPAHHLRYRDVLEAFKPLENIEFVHREAGACDVTVVDELSDLLRQAKKLRRLEVEFGHVNISRIWGVDDVFSLSPLFSSREDQERGTSAAGEHTSALSAYWPDLEHLSLKTNVKYPEFSSFLRQHGATLRSLELRDMIVGDAPALLRDIPKILGLDRVHLSSIWSANPEHVPDVKGFAYYVYLQSTIRSRRLSIKSSIGEYDGVYENAVKEYLLRQCEELPELKIEGMNGMGSVDSEAESDEEDEDDDDEEEEEDGNDDEGGEV